MSRHTTVIISERIALITYRLVMGQKLKVMALTLELGVDRRTIFRDLNAISRVVPVCSEQGFWQLCEGAERPQEVKHG